MSRPAAGEEEVPTMIEFDTRPCDRTVPDAEREAVLASPGFGQIFTDHMITARWSAGEGWHDARLEPYGPFTLDPATSVFHYSQEFFEGLKAYRQDNGSIAMFRPDAAGTTRAWRPTGRSRWTRLPRCSTTPRSSSRG